MRTCLTCIQDHQEKPIFVIQCLDKNSFDLLEIISPVVTQVKIINGSLAIIDKTEVSNVNCDEVNKAETIPEVMVLISSYLRLLLCSKEELSLARAVTASGRHGNNLLLLSLFFVCYNRIENFSIFRPSE